VIGAVHSPENVLGGGKLDTPFSFSAVALSVVGFSRHFDLECNEFWQILEKKGCSGRERATKEEEEERI